MHRLMWRWTDRQRWWMLAAGWAVLLVLGVGGFLQQSDELDLNTTFLDQLYFTLQLAALDYKGSPQAINWRLQVVRFAVPVMAAGTLLQSASLVFREQFARWRAGRSRGHTVVCGLNPVGTRLVEALVADGRTVVAIHDTPNSAGAAAVGRVGVPVIYGDPTERSVLSAARADRAARVVAVHDSDGVNVAVAAAVRDLPLRSAQPALRCSVRLTDGELAHLLRSTELSRGDALRIEFFNVQERAAHALLAAHALASEDPDRPARLLVMGIGQLGGNVIVTAAQQWADRGAGPLPITLIDRQATGRMQALMMQHPALATAATATMIDLDIGAPRQQAVELFEQTIAEHPPTLAVVAFEDETLAWTSALFVRRRVTKPVDIVVRTDADGGFGRHLQATIDRGEIGHIVTFPFLDRACSVDLIEGGVREQLARAMHEDYLADNATTGQFQRAWDQLTDDERESSRAAADAVVTRLADIGAQVVPLQRWGATDTAFTGDELNTLAAAEHERWRNERLANGWVHGEVRDDAARVNPLLVPWESVPEGARQYNLDTAQRLPAMLARAGFQITRT